jgi:CubicO group peptidase (beta-lactamase class C family)
MSAEDVGMSTDRLDRVSAVCRRYVDTGRLPCTDVQIARRGQVVYRDTYGSADLQNDRPLDDDTIFRIYSMTKPITSIALMQLYEQGEVLLENRVDRFIPEFAEVQVWTGGTEDAPQVRAPSRPITVHDVLTHMSGLTYGFMFAHPVDAIYRHNDLGNFTRPDISLAESMEILAGIPLQFDPGSRWNYSMSTDVCGRIVEVASGMTLDAYLDQHIFAPLGMVDTGFWLNDEQLPRLAACYTRTPETRLLEIDPAASPVHAQPPAFLSGGGGLLSTTADYQRFCDMLLNRGELDGRRIIGPRTLDYMTSNHLPGNATLNEMGQVTFSEATMEGTGFGLGFSVLVDPAANEAIGTPGEFGWGGAASTTFWIDPVEELSVIFMTQLLPSNTYPIRRFLKPIVLQALID